MRLASRKASPLDNLQEAIAQNSDEVARAETIGAILGSRLWEDVRIDASSRRQVYGSAHINRIERELTERFGIFNILHPSMRQLMLLAETTMKTRFIGDPLLPAHTCVVILFMAHRGGMPWIKMTLLACLLFALHPVVAMFGLLLLQNLSRQKRSRVERIIPRSAPDSCKVDVLIYGGGIRGLYSGALLARAGRRVTVLVPNSQNHAGATVWPNGAPCEFVLDRCEFGQISYYETLLSACVHPSRPLYFKPVGSAKTGWAHAVVVARDLRQPLPLRSGAQAWIDDRSCEFGVDRGILAVALRQAVAVARDFPAYVATKLPKSSTALDSSTSDVSPRAKSFVDARSITASEAIANITRLANATVSFPKTALQSFTTSMLLHEDHLLADPLSFAAWSTATIDGIDGYHVPDGGTAYLCASLQATILACDGQVMTSMTVHDIEIKDDCSDPVVVVAGPSGIGGRLEKFLAQKIILAVDLPEGLDMSHRARQSKIPRTSQCVPKQSQLIRHTLVVFKGTCKAFDAPHAVPIFWQNGVPAWNTITFRDVPNGVVACVVEGSWTDIPQTAESTETLNLYHENILERLVYLFPQTAGKSTYIYTPEPPRHQFMQTPLVYPSSERHNIKIVQKNIHRALSEFALSDAAESVIAGYVAAHATLEGGENALRSKQPFRLL